MTQVQGEAPAKVFDPEETRQETAHRLFQRDIAEIDRTVNRFVQRSRLHARSLSEADRARLTAHLRRSVDRAVGIVEALSDEAPEFSFIPDDGGW